MALTNPIISKYTETDVTPSKQLNSPRVIYAFRTPQNIEALQSPPPVDQPYTDFKLFIRRNHPQICYATEDSLLAGHWARYFKRKGRNRLSLALQACDRMQHADALIATGEDIGLHIGLAAYLKRMRCPIYMIFHGFYPDSPKMAAVARLLNRYAYMNWVCLSQSLADRLVAQYGVPAHQCHVISHGVDSDYFTPYVAFPATPYVVSAGMSNRDYPMLIKALAGVDIDCRIAADSTWHPHQILPSDVMQLLSERITARSYENYTNLRELYNGAAFAVVPLKQAPYACGYAVIAEAMAMAKAVIATRTHSESDLIIEGETGFYVEPGDVEGLRERIVYLLHNPDVAKAMGIKARERVCASFSLQHYCEAFERLIRERVTSQQA